jgi:hypothetical protein
MCAAAATLNPADGGESAAQLLSSPEEIGRLVGVTALGAIDALPKFFKAINDPQHADVRRQTILVLRQWLGREPGQIKRFQHVLMEEKKLNPTQVKNALSLVLGFDSSERAMPSTYDFLIDCLTHKSMAVRELAHWHLVRLAPAGNSILFDAALPPEQQQDAVARWRALIPPGQVPNTSAKSQVRN